MHILLLYVEICDPDFSIPISNVATIIPTLSPFITPPPVITINLTAPNGMCSYGVGNTGNYDSSFSKIDIKDQAFGNPAGKFCYGQLLSQAKMQTYIITELFGSTCIPKSVFSVFLPYNTCPTTDFLNAQPPTDPNPTEGNCK